MVVGITYNNLNNEFSCRGTQRAHDVKTT